MSHYQNTVEKHARQDMVQNAEDIRAVMATPAGRRLFHSMTLHQGGIYRHSHPEDDRAYCDGRRDAMIELMAAVNAIVPEMVLLAIKEHNDVITARNDSLKAAAELDESKTGRK